MGKVFRKLITYSEHMHWTPHWT